MGEIQPSPPSTIDVSLRHLQAELSRIDVLLRREVRRWQAAGQEPNDTFRGLYVSDTQADELLARPLSTSWGQTVVPAPGEVEAFAEAEAQAARQAQALVENAQAQGHTPRLLQLANAFGLGRFELDTLLICLASSLDLRYERIYSYLQDDVTRKRPGVNLVLDLLAEPGPERLLCLAHFAADAPLFKYRLLEPLSDSEPESPLLSTALSVDETITAWLLGRYRPHARLASYATLLWPEEDETDTLLAAEMFPGLGREAAKERPGPVPGERQSAVSEDHLERPPVSFAEPPIFVFYGPDCISQDAAARLNALRVGRPLLRVDVSGVIEAGSSPLEAVSLALRDARLAGAIPYLVGWDTCLVEDGTLAPAVLAELLAYPDTAILAGQTTWQAAGVDRMRALRWLEFPAPAFPQRRTLWEHFLDRPSPGSPLCGQGETSDLAALAGQFGLTSGQIRDAVASARDIAAQRGDPLQIDDLFAAARAHSNPRLSSLARKILPRYGWQDIILPDDELALLHEIVNTVRGRPLVLDEWGVGRKLASSAGVPILFAGPPGTGKTMAAEIIAAELGLDLFKIDLSTVVSKYIGETEKNLEKIFNEAQSSNAILFFDEADAIFGKRSEVKDAHDRYANIEISYLLQRMEAYDGVTVLATNLRANLDEAFTRRLHFSVDFPFPEEADRLRIWHTLFPPDVPREPDLDFAFLARRFKLAGGNIRNIIVSAAYLAAADGELVTMGHLLHGTRRELQKMGRLVDEGDMTLEA